MNVPQGPAELHSLLESSNLISYKSALLEQGADDVDQLVSLTAEEFQQLCSMIGMDKKPFHVMRLRKALEKWSKSQTPPPPAMSIDESPTMYSLPAVVPSNSQVLTSSQIPSVEGAAPSKTVPPLLLHVAQVTDVPPPESSVRLFLPPYLHPEANTSDFSPLVDYLTPVQTTLPPCGFRPDTWDPSRKDVIRKYASIYRKEGGKKQDMITPFEEHVNEAAYQLCLRDPTLLVRRDELFLLAKRAVRQGYDYHHTVPEVPQPPLTVQIGQKRPRSAEVSPVHNALPVPRRNHTDFMKGRLSSKERLSRMKTIRAEIEANKAFQQVKIVAMEEAKQRSDFTTSTALRDHIKSLGTELKELEDAYAVLKHREGRSIRYFRNKNTNTAAEDQSVNSESSSAQGDVFSPIETIVVEPEDPPVFVKDEPSSEGESSKPAAKPARVHKRKATPKKVKTKSLVARDSSESDIKDLVDNVTNATDQLNSIISGEEVTW